MNSHIPSHQSDKETKKYTQQHNNIIKITAEQYKQQAHCHISHPT